ncbi:MAG TPA: GTP 3',8-cyclase MoaA [Desulfosarcina sp.]|nr:GTP 3',8-cyclase MoaA [Desulfosarcina sp.]
MSLIDAHGRVIDYLRLSVTDRCNLQCRYCTPMAGRRHLARRDVLTYEELLRLSRAAVSAGIRKIRITGGEPLVRKGIVDFCRQLSAIEGLQDVALTTNGILLKAMAAPLFEAGIRRINVSLDTLRPGRFQAITGCDRLADVLDGLEEAARVGFAPIKLNVVVLRGINDDEIPSIAELTLDHPCHVRFIELMPVAHWSRASHRERFMPAEAMMRRIPALAAAQADATMNTAGPARMYRLPNARGRVGFIAPLSRHFCGRCNRLRTTVDGKIRSCLFSEEELEVKTALRSGASTFALIRILRQSVARKPRRHRLDGETPSDKPSDSRRGMYAIGG